MPAAFAVRQAHPDDTLLLADLFYHLSERTRYQRYFRVVPLSLAAAWAEARRMARRSPRRGLTLVATLPAARHAAPGEAIGAAELAGDPAAPWRGELAVVVRDDHQGRGVGTALGRRLVAAARAAGIAELHADVLPDNRRMLRLLRRLGPPTTAAFDGGLTHMVLRLER